MGPALKDAVLHRGNLGDNDRRSVIMYSRNFYWHEWERQNYLTKGKFYDAFGTTNLFPRKWVSNAAQEIVVIEASFYILLRLERNRQQTLYYSNTYFK